jgi:hypothetical protein
VFENTKGKRLARVIEDRDRLDHELTVAREALDKERSAARERDIARGTKRDPDFRHTCPICAARVTSRDRTLKGEREYATGGMFNMPYRAIFEYGIWPTYRDATFDTHKVTAKSEVKTIHYACGSKHVIGKDTKFHPGSCFVTPKAPAKAKRSK